MADFRFSFDSRFELDTSELDRFLNDPSGEVGQFLEARGRAILIAAKRQVGVETGALRESIHMIHQRIGGIQQIWIGSDNQIALIHHEGTRPHAIEARNAGSVVRFSSRGRTVYSRTIMHPGTKPNHYLSDNLYLAYV